MRYKLIQSPKPMKTLIVYYSKTGNTKKVAEELAGRLGADADIEEIIDRKNRFGFLNWFRSGRDGLKKELTTIQPTSCDPSRYDLIVLGSPVWGWNMVPAVRTYFEKNKEKIKSYAFFVTSGNTPVEKIRPYFEEISGRPAAAGVGFSAKEMKDKDIFGQKVAEFLSKLTI